MRTTRHRYDERDDPFGIGPQIGFVAATCLGFAAWSGLIFTAPRILVMPVIATLFLVLVAGFAVFAWRRRGEDPTRVTYADVAGALTLIGLFASTTIDSGELLRLVSGTH